MTKRQTILYLIVCFISLPLTIKGIFRISRIGGPCNAGVVFIMMMFVFCLCLTLLSVPFVKIVSNKSSGHAKTLSVVALAIWTFCLFTLGNDGDAGSYSLIYLSSFDLFILLTLFFANEMKVAQDSEAA